MSWASGTQSVSVCHSFMTCLSCLVVALGPLLSFMLCHIQLHCVVHKACCILLCGCCCTAGRLLLLHCFNASVHNHCRQGCHNPSSTRARLHQSETSPHGGMCAPTVESMCTTCFFTQSNDSETLHQPVQCTFADSSPTGIGQQTPNMRRQQPHRHWATDTEHED